MTTQPTKTQPLKGSWHHGNGYLCNGTVRIMRADFDTNPSDGFKQALLDWICMTLNEAVEARHD